MLGRYGVEFKLTAVEVSQSPGVPIKDVAVERTLSW
jgi:transposase-like protein